jgi:hypothetical protein
MYEMYGRCLTQDGQPLSCGMLLPCFPYSYPDYVSGQRIISLRFRDSRDKVAGRSPTRQLRPHIAGHGGPLVTLESPRPPHYDRIVVLAAERRSAW